MRLLYLLLAAILSSSAVNAQVTPQPLMVVRIRGIGPTWAGECAAGVIDNRSSATRQNNFHTLYATGSGTWNVALQYSDTACSGPWVSFGVPSSITNTSAAPVITGVGYHAYFKITVTGAALATYSAAKDFFPNGSGDPGPTGQGVPVGGTADQVLAKISSSNYDTHWVNPSGGSGTFTALHGTGNPNGEVSCTSPNASYLDDFNSHLYWCTGTDAWTDMTSGAAIWGQIGGTLALQTDLTDALNAKANVGHTHAQTDVTGLTTALAGKEATANKGQPSGYAPLNNLGKIDTAYLPASAGLTAISQDLAPVLGGNLSVNGFNIGGVTALELGRLSGVTSAIQTQINGKETIDATILRQANLAGTGSAITPAHSDHNHTTIYLPINNAAMTGIPTAPTAAQNNNSTQVATTSYVDTGLATKAASAASTTVNGQVCALGSTCTVAVAAPTACVGVPGNTTGGYGTQCNVRTTGALYSCINASGCTVAADWAAVDAGGSGGTTVNVNGSSVSAPNFNGSTPVVEANYLPVKFQVSGSNVSAEVAYSTPYTCTVSGVSSIACTHNLNTSTPWVACYDAGGNMLSAATATILTGVVATSADIATLTFDGTTTATCVISSGSMGRKGDAGADGTPGTPGTNGTNGAMSDPGSNGIPNRSALNTLVPANAHNVASILTCTAAGASSTAYTCSTAPTFTPAAKDSIVFCPDIANTGASTLVVNSQSGTPAIKRQQGQVSLVANDLRASPAGCTLLRFDGTNWNMEGQGGNPLTSNGSVMMTAMSSGGLAASETAYLGVGQVSKASNETSREIVMPISCTINNLMVWLADGSTQTASGSITVKMRKNEADQTLTCAVPAGTVGHALACSDTTHPISYVGGTDRLAVKVVNNSATTTSAAIQAITWSCQ